MSIKINITTELKDVFSSNEIKTIYSKKGMNPFSANYFIKKNVDNGSFIKIQKGLYFKEGANLKKLSINEYFKNMNNKYFSLLDDELINKFDITNAVFNSRYVFVKYIFYKNNENLFKFLKKNKLVNDIIIISGKKHATNNINNHAKVFATKFANPEKDEYKHNARNLIKNINKTTLEKIIKEIKLSISESIKVREIYNG